MSESTQDSFLIKKGELGKDWGKRADKNELVSGLLHQVIGRLQLLHPEKITKEQGEIDGEISRVQVFDKVNEYYDYIEQTTDFKFNKIERIKRSFSSIATKGVYSQYQDKDNKTQRVVLILGKKATEEHLIHELTHVGQSILEIVDFSKRDDSYSNKIKRGTLGLEILFCSLSGMGIIAKFRPEDILPERFLAAAGIIGLASLMEGQYSYEDVAYEKEANLLAGLVEP